MRRLATALAFALILAGCAGDEPEPDPGSADATGTPSEGAIDLGSLDAVAGSLEVPWDLAFVDDDTFLVTERPGRVRLVDQGVVRDEPLAEIEVRSESEAGLLGIALHPEFAQQRFAYLYYTADDENRVTRYPVGDDLSFGDEEVVVDGIPAAGNHDGGRIAFGPDGLLYVGTGDATRPELAADRESLAGKILRVTPDGSVPDDNPFDGSPVYSYGHRNVQGLAWDADGNMYATEHGPTGEAGRCCHDEINRIEAGGNYGWPSRAGRTSTGIGSASGDTIDPIAESGSQNTWAPAGIAVDRSSDEPSLLVAGLGGAVLFRFAMDGGDPEVALRDEGRLRAVRFGPDGCLYLTTSNRDGRGRPEPDDDRVLRACPPH